MGNTEGTSNERADLVEAAFRDLCPSVLTAARKAGLAAADCWDVVQRLGLVLVEKLDSYEPSQGSIYAWGAGIAHNILLDTLRDRRVQRARLDRSASLARIPDPALTPEESLRAQEVLRIFASSVAEEHRAVFELDALGCSAREVGEALGIPPNTAVWKLAEAREDLRRALKRMGEDRRSATRVRAVVWPFASAWDRACRLVRAWLRRHAGVLSRSPLLASPEAMRRRLAVAVAGTLPALLSVHFAKRPLDDLRLAEGRLATRAAVGTAAAGQVMRAAETVHATPAESARTTRQAGMEMSRCEVGAPRELGASCSARVPSSQTSDVSERGTRLARPWLILREKVSIDVNRPTAPLDVSPSGAGGTPRNAGPSGAGGTPRSGNRP